MNQYAVIVIGGGPAGLFCSLLLGKGGCKTLLLEKMPTCGRKLLLSGSGQCNLTHTGPISEFISHYGDHGRFIRPALMHFSNVKLISFFQDRGVPFRDDGNGKYFRESGKAGISSMSCSKKRMRPVHHPYRRAGAYHQS